MPTQSVFLGGVGINVENGMLAIANYEHIRIHDGNLFSAAYYFGSISNNGTATFSIVSGTISPHAVFMAQVGGNSHAYLIEGGTVTGAGTMLSSNHCRTSTNVPVAVILTGGTLTGGTIIRESYLAGGAGPHKPGGSWRAESEYVLLQNITTSVSIVNISGSDMDASIEIDFYEENE